MSDKKKVKLSKRILQILILLIVIIVVLGIYYFAIMDRWSKPVIKEEMGYKVKTEKYANRNVFVVSPKDNKTSTKTILFLHK